MRFLSQFQTLDSYAEVFEEDGEILADAIENDAFNSIRNDVIAADTFFQEVNDLDVYYIICTLFYNKYLYKKHQAEIRQS